MTFTNNVTNVTIHYCTDISGSDVQFAIYQFVILFGAPATLMIVCYTYVIRELWKSTRNMQMLTNNVGSRKDKDHRSFYKRWRSKYAGTSTILVPSSQLPLEDRTAKGTVSRPRRSVDTSTSGKYVEKEVCMAYVPGCSGKPNKDKRKNKGEDARKARKQVIKMLILVVVMFLCCWGPRIVLEIIIKLQLITFTQTMYSVRVTLNILPFIHACMNPFIYSFMSKNFRRSLHRQAGRISCLKKRCYNGGGNKMACRSESRGRTIQGSSVEAQPTDTEVTGHHQMRGSTSSSTNYNTDHTKHTDIETAFISTTAM